MWAQFVRIGPAPQHGAPDDATGPAGWIRRGHRWMALAFTACTLANFAAMAFGPPPPLITYSPLPPLFLLMGSGLTMLVARHRSNARARRGRAPRGESTP